MIGKVFNMCGTAIGQVVNWFSQLDGVLQFSGFVVAAFTLYTMVRILINPLIGNASSDLANYSYNKAKNYVDRKTTKVTVRAKSNNRIKPSKSSGGNAAAR